MKTRLLFFAITLGFLTACNDDPEPANIEINLQFDHVVDSEPLQLDQLIYTNAAGQNYSVKTLKYFVSGFKLYRLDGSFIPFDDVHYIDIRESATLSFTLSKKITAGDYAGITFVHGLAKEDNITGRFTEQPESLMEWPTMMGGGYHYMKLEGEYVSRTTEDFFNFHSGALDGTEYEVNVDLTGDGFSVEQELNLALTMEIQNWFTNPVDWDFDYFGSGIMGNPEAQNTVQKNGRDVYSYTIIE